jgi:deoxycytidine triphosphate deaminase
MTVLVDRELDQLLATSPPLATNVPRGDFSGPRSQIQAASLDLTIGDIFIPGTDANKPGGSGSPHTKVCLREGRIAVIRTQESLALPSNLVALGFPPASLSIQGVLMTNPGQIDPGYRGPMHLTIINMSKEPLPLQRGQRVIRLIFAKLDAVPSADYQARHPDRVASPITDELLQALSIDFLNVEQRANDIVKSAQVRTGIWSAAIAAAVGIVVACLTTFIPRYFDRYYALESGLNTLAAKVDVATLKDRVDRLESAAKPAVAASAPAAVPSPLPIAATPGPAPAPSPAPPPTPAQVPKP